ncbi:LysR family transcriptional regulator [Mycolicibacterium flavescens]|nr:LysR family transcriptional regulator [Mycolicibacterium flavescens]
MRTLVAVAEHGGFTAAGYELGISQPAVSRAIAALEKELGTPLLHRGRDGIALTQAGSVALAHAREALRHIRLMRDEAAASTGQLVGTLSLASLPSVTASLIAPHIKTFTQRYPAVEFRLLEGSEEEVRDWLDGGAAEVGVVSLPIHGLDSVVLGEQDMVAVVPADHRLAGLSALRYTDLATEPFIWSTGGCASAFAPVAQTEGVEFDVAFEARSMSAVLEIARAGLGVSIMPSAGLPELPDGVVVRTLVPRTVRKLGVAASASASAPARAFLEHVSQH